MKRLLNVCFFQDVLNHQSCQSESEDGRRMGDGAVGVYFGGMPVVFLLALIG